MKCVCGHTRDWHEGKPLHLGGSIKEMLDARCRMFGCRCESFKPKPDLTPQGEPLE